MPRTKVSKSSKRNREAANREEKIREFENTFEGFQNTFDSLIQDYIKSYKQQFRMLLQRTNSALLQIKICDLLEMVSVCEMDDVVGQGDIDVVWNYGAYLLVHTIHVSYFLLLLLLESGAF